MTLTNFEITAILGFMALIITVITPVIRLNSTMTKLSTTLENFIKQMEDNHGELKGRVDRHGEQIDELALSLKAMKKDISFNTKHIDECEIRRKLMRGEL